MEDQELKEDTREQRAHQEQGQRARQTKESGIRHPLWYHHHIPIKLPNCFLRWGPGCSVSLQPFLLATVLIQEGSRANCFKSHV